MGYTHKARMAPLAAVAVLALAAAGCGGSSGGSASSSGSSSSSSSGGGGGGGGGSIKIGVPVPLSGDYASAGTDIYHGAQLAADYVNSHGGVNGKKITLLQADDACSAQVGAQAAAKLISQGVVAVAGGYCSTASLPELSAFHRAGIPFVMDASTNPQLTEQGYAEAFRDIGRDDAQGPFVAKFISQFLHAKTAAVMNDNSTYSKGLADATVAALKQDGVKVVYNNSITPGQSDYTPALTSVKSANPDVFYYSGYFSEAALLLKQGQQIGLKAQMMGGDATNDPSLLKTAGTAANGFILDTAPLAAQLGAEGQQFLTNYKQKFSDTPGPYSVYEYDAVRVLAQAIQNAKSTKGSDIVAALKKINYKGITGEIQFNSKGDRTKPEYITLKVVNGQFTPFKTLQNGQWVDVPSTSGSASAAPSASSSS